MLLLAAFLLAMTVFVWRVIETHFHLLSGGLPPANLLARTDIRMDALLWGCLAAIYFPRMQGLAARIRFSQLWFVPVAMILVVQKLHPPGRHC